MFILKRLWKTIKKLFLAVKKVITLNIATMIFSALFLYMLITVFLYVTSSHVTSYQVTSGTLAKNPVYTALAIRSEEIVTSDHTGYIRYLAREGMKVRKNGNVYAIGDSQLQTAEIPLSTDQQKEIQKKSAEFSNSFESSDFYDTYSFKYQLEGIMIPENKTTSAPAEAFENNYEKEETQQYDENGLPAVEGNNSITLGNQTVCTAPSAGLVVYYTDGYEGKTADDLSLDDFNQKSYQKKDLITNDKIESGDSVYKLITSDNWTLMVPISDKIASRLSGRTSVQVKFLADGKSQNGQLSIFDIDGQKVARIDLKNGMIRYTSSRFLNVELVINTTTGLKIPTSSIVTKAFYLIPSEYLTHDDDGNEGFIAQTVTKNNNLSEENFVSATIYKNDAEEDDDESQIKEQYCYVDKETFHEGDIIHKPDSSETFTVGEIDYLDGVYCMNKGYAVFRRVDTLQSNEEFCLVKKNTLYGLSEFDRIVREGESVQEEDILTGK
ncbi:MAG: HlyD family efflux transporter periplasmic adaptor subunit [Blautia sp.]